MPRWRQTHSKHRIMQLDPGRLHTHTATHTSTAKPSARISGYHGIKGLKPPSNQKCRAGQDEAWRYPARKAEWQECRTNLSLAPATHITQRHKDTDMSGEGAGEERRRGARRIPMRTV